MPSINTDFQEVGVVQYGYVSVTIVLFFVVVVLRGLAVGKTSSHDIR